MGGLDIAYAEAFIDGIPLSPVSDAPESPGRSGKMPKRLFYQLLFDMLNNPKVFGEYLWWSEDGQRFYINRKKIIESRILGRVFKTHKLESFERQLRGYSFKAQTDNRKSKDKGKVIVPYMHPHFQRDHPEMLNLIRNKGNHKKTQMRHQAKLAKANGVLQQTPSPTVSLPAMHTGFDTNHTYMLNTVLPSPPYSSPILDHTFPFSVELAQPCLAPIHPTNAPLMLPPAQADFFPANNSMYIHTPPYQMGPEPKDYAEFITRFAFHPTFTS
ncbi:hypothetical protein H4R34_004596 [Dimargaris verticillata]|uniref:HSF-type DNA-binding domain-containing protein n=1 Tax=Dimargaris verticillata TaxID=2761393 RepID=A0A9W8B0C0_9FUNG|nr:hypothetical protein H4R34_004596 [Dimargaris verticillata]